MNILDKIDGYIKKENMIDAGDGIVVALSGGADSVALFLCLNKLREKYGLHLVAAHVNHMIRGEEADQDEEYVRRLGQEYNVPVEVLKKNVPQFAKEMSMTEEEAGRYIRYEFFREIEKKYGYKKVAVAHHMDDLCETVIFNMIRGSGIKGLVGILPVRDDVIRPLLCVDKEEIKEFLKEENVTYCIDKTNFDTDYSRNRIRNVIIPELLKINSKAVYHIGRISNSLREINEGFEKEADNYKFFSKDNKRSIECADIKELDKNIRYEIYLRMIESLVSKRKDITGLHLESIDRLVLKEETGKSINIPYDILVRNSYGKLIMLIENKCDKDEAALLQRHFKVEIIDADEKLIDAIIKKEIPDERLVKMIDFGKIKGGIEFRYPEEGDTIVIDSKGSTKKISRIFIDEKIDREKRKVWPLVVDSNNVIWVSGLRLSPAFHIDKDTKKICKITYYPVTPDRKE